MTGKSLKIALAASVALNLFAVAAGATLLVGRHNVAAQVENDCRPSRQGSPMEMVQQVSEPERERVRASLRQAAMAAKPDFEEARRLRREAIAAARSETFDAARVSALLEQSRASEARGRSRLEANAIQLFDSLSPRDRAALADILVRRRGGGYKVSHAEMKKD